MVFHRRRMAAPIQTIKHYVQLQRTATVTASVLSFEIVEAVSVAAVGAATDQVEEGSIVKAVYIEMWEVADQDAMGSMTAVLEKRPSASPAITSTNLANLGAYPNKKNILYTFQGLTPGQDQNPIPILRGWFMIPKGKQRMGLGDKIVLSITPVSGGCESCGFSTYKEYK